MTVVGPPTIGSWKRSGRSSGSAGGTCCAAAATAANRSSQQCSGAPVDSRTTYCDRCRTMMKPTQRSEADSARWPACAGLDDSVHVLKASSGAIRSVDGPTARQDASRSYARPEVFGYWAGLTAFTEDEHGSAQAFQLGGAVAVTGARSLAWLRIRVRRAGWRMGEISAAAAFEWLRDRTAMREALTTVANMQMYVHVFTEEGVQYELSLRPVFRPRLERDAPRSEPAAVVSLHARRSA